MLTAKNIAEYFLSLVDDDAEDLMSNLKIQKLVYYAQGFHLALYGELLFPEPIEAWAHGPVVPSLYHEYKGYGTHVIPRPMDIDFSIYEESVKDLLNEVYYVYGQYSPWKLRSLTHEEPPWINAEKQGTEISHDSMKQYFKTLLVENDQES